jgi:hypothetical protein
MGESLRSWGQPTNEDDMAKCGKGEKKDGRGRCRSYAKEYREYHGKPAEIAHRSDRNEARRILGLRRGDPREADHKRPIESGGSNARSNLRAISRHANRTRKNPSKR